MIDRWDAERVDRLLSFTGDADGGVSRVLLSPTAGDRSGRSVDAAMPNDDLVHFGRPPLSEVALSIQFESLTAFSYAEIGALRDHFRSSFPRVEYHPPLPPAFETFGPPSVLTMPFPFPFASIGGMPRVWLIDEQGVDVLQFQPDRFTRNWRKTENDAEYPHYDTVRSTFLSDLHSLAAFLEERKLGGLVPTQCEITYVNQLSAPDGYAELMGRAFSNWRNVRPSVLGESDNVAFNMSFVLSGAEGAPVGRVYFQATSGFDNAGQRVVHLMVIGRGAPATSTIEGAVDLLDLAHGHIVKSFLELTTAEIQAEWERRA